MPFTQPPEQPSSAADSCSTLSYAEHNGDVASSQLLTPAHHHSPPSDGNAIEKLIESEPHHMPRSDYPRRCRDLSIDVTARQDSINWILKVTAFYRFGPVTAFLSVNYLDRFLSYHPLPHANGWPFQLLSVACLSLAAKMEEPQMPLLLDLQVSDPKFIFEPLTVQRMELRVLSTLNWRLRSATPFDYLHHFISKLPSSATAMPDSYSRLLSGSSDLILGTTRVIDFMGFSSSTIAAAAVTCVAGQNFGYPVTDGIVFHDRVNGEMVRSCHQLMEEYLTDTCYYDRGKELRTEPAQAPPSPVGVLDAAPSCGSCDTRSVSENPGSGGGAERPAKRLRSSAPDVQQQR